MDFKEKTALLNEYFLRLYQNKSEIEKQACTDSPLAALTYNDLRVFEVIEMRRRLNMRDLSVKLGLAMSTLTGIVDKLVEKGYVKRHRCAQDRRVVYAELTEEGNKIFARRKSANTSISEGILSALSEEEQDEFLRLFKKAIS